MRVEREKTKTRSVSLKGIRTPRVVAFSTAEISVHPVIGRSIRKKCSTGRVYWLDRVKIVVYATKHGAKTARFRGPPQLSTLTMTSRIYTHCGTSN